MRRSEAETDEKLLSPTDKYLSGWRPDRFED
jgi:hypothetical protein